MTGGRGAVFMEKKSVIPLRDEVTRNKASNGLGVGEVGGPLFQNILNASRLFICVFLCSLAFLFNDYPRAIIYYFCLSC